MANHADNRSEPRAAHTLTLAGGPVAAAMDVHRRQLTLRTLADRLALAGAAAGLLPLLVVVGDHLLAGGLPRMILGAALLAWVLGLLVALIGVPAVTALRRLNPLYVARQIERLRGIRHSSVVNALLLLGNGRERHAALAALRQAARDVASHPEMAGDRPPRRHLPELALLSVAAAWLLYFAVSSKPVGPSLARFLGFDLIAPTATRLELVRPGPGDVVHAGEPLVIEFAVHGRAVSAVILEIMAAADGTSTVRTYNSRASIADGVDLRRFALAPIEVQGDIHYRCRAGDAVLAGVIPVLPLPDIEALDITLEPPEYTGRGPHPAASPDLDVLAGTRATFRMRANGLLADPVFVLSGQRETRTRMRVLTESPDVATLTLRLGRSGLYRIEFSDAWGSPYRGPREHRLDVRPDQPPTVTITAPAAGELPGDVVNIARYSDLVALAKDDVGVARLEFVTDSGSGDRAASADRKRQTRPRAVPGPVTARLDLLSAADSARSRIEARVPLSELTLAPGQTLRAWFEATDGRVLLDGRVAPQSARSRVVTLLYDPAPEESAQPEAPDQSEEQPASDSEAQPTEHSEAETEAAEGAQPSDEEVDSPPDEPQGEQPASRPSAEGDSRSGAAASQPTSRPTAGASDQPERDPTESAAGKSGAERSSAGGELGRELEEFVRKHGGEAKEAARRARAGRAGKPDCEDGRAPQPTGRDDEGKEESDGDSSPEARPGGGSAPADSDGAEASPSASGESGKSGAGQSPGQSGPSPPEPDDAARGEGQGGGEGQPASGQGAGDSETGAEEADADPSQGDAAGGASSGSGADSADGDESDVKGPGQPEPTTQPAEAESEAEALAESGGLVETIDLLEMLERGEGIDTDALVEAGWSPEQAAAFVKALERLHAATREAGGVNALRRVLFDTRVGDDEVRMGRGLSGAVKRVAEAAETRHDRLRRIAPPAEQDVPEDIEELLEAYYRSLAADTERADK